MVVVVVFVILLMAVRVSVVVVTFLSGVGALFVVVVALVRADIPH